MLRLKLGRSLSNDVIEPEKPTATERFTRVLDRLKFEYDLPNDVLAEAEAVLQALKARERNAHLPALSKLGRLHETQSARPIFVEIRSTSKNSLLAPSVITRPARGQ